jgi:hypothetical protein
VEDILRRYDLRRAASESGDSKGNTRILKADVEHLKLSTSELTIQRKRIGFS